ncbi:tetratricopeptide repeat protein, partial [PVC group bacterium]|nr:tetratricopeptide repeat protein [PVC group bacterium]
MSQCKCLKNPVFFIGLTLFMMMGLECHFDNALYARGKTKHSKDADKNTLSENLKTRPDDIRILNPLSKIYLEEGNYQKAFPLLLKIIEIDPRQVKAHYNLGMLYQIRALHDRAEQEFQIAARLDPEDPDIHFNLGNIYYKTGDYQKSIDQYLMTTQINPMYKDAFYNLAGVYDDMNEVELALNAYRTVLKINPSDTNVKLKIKSLKQKMNLYQDSSDLEVPGTPPSIIRFDDPTVVILKEPKISDSLMNSRNLPAGV